LRMFWRVAMNEPFSLQSPGSFWKSKQWQSELTDQDSVQGWSRKAVSMCGPLDPACHAVTLRSSRSLRAHGFGTPRQWWKRDRNKAKQARPGCHFLTFLSSHRAALSLVWFHTLPVATQSPRRECGQEGLKRSLCHAWNINEVTHPSVSLESEMASQGLPNTSSQMSLHLLVQERPNV
jgi:hypothetical protein